MSGPYLLNSEKLHLLNLSPPSKSVNQRYLGRALASTPSSISRVSMVADDDSGVDEKDQWGSEDPSLDHDSSKDLEALYNISRMDAEKRTIHTPEEEIELAKHMFSQYQIIKPGSDHPRGSGWGEICQMLTDKLRDDRKIERRKRRVPSRYDVFADPMFGDDICEGDSRLEALRETLDSFSYKRTAVQKIFHKAFTQASLARIYMDEWDGASVRVLKQERLSRLQTEVELTGPRRFGKTIAVSMWVLAALLHIPGIKIGIFATGMRAATMLMNSVVTLMHDISGAQRRVCKQNQNELYIAAQPLPEGATHLSQVAVSKQNLRSTSTLKCYPASSDSK